MKRYLTLLTVSFLSTSTLVKAGKFDIFDLPQDRNEKIVSLRAKAGKLQKNIDNMENADLRAAFAGQHRVIDAHLNDLVRGQLNQPNYDAYFQAKEQENKIKASFVEEVKNRTHDQQFDKIHDILRWGIYAPESSEYQDLMEAMRSVSSMFNNYSMTERDLVKMASRYLKMEKLITQHVQKADKIIDEYMVDIKKIEGSSVQKDLEIIRYSLDYESPEYEVVRNALYLLDDMRRSDADLGFLIESFLRYKELEGKLDPLLTSYRQLKQETPAFIASVFSGAGDYVKMEEELSSLYPYYGAPGEVQEFLDIMRQIKALPQLLIRLKGLQPKVQELLANPPSSGDGNTSPLNQASAIDHAWIDDTDFERMHVDSDSESSDSSALHHVAKTFRTAGANPNARVKHSAISILLPKQELQSDAYKLVVNHRTSEKGPMVRIYNPKIKNYTNLGTLPASSDFRDMVFDITDWTKAVRDDSTFERDVATYLSFLNGKSDIHSFRIESEEEVLKEIILGDVGSESQAGIHVYSPEKSGDANEWSVMESDDKE